MAKLFTSAENTVELTRKFKQEYKYLTEIEINKLVFYNTHLTQAIKEKNEVEIEILVKEIAEIILINKNRERS